MKRTTIPIILLVIGEILLVVAMYIVKGLFDATLIAGIELMATGIVWLIANSTKIYHNET